jgi:glycosyltransferase involved in cell wall biosynthesis
MLPDEQRELVVPCEEGALATALGRLVADAALRERLGTLNRARVEERYSFEAMLTAYRDLYLETLAR